MPGLATAAHIAGELSHASLHHLVVTPLLPFTTPLWHGHHSCLDKAPHTPSHCVRASTCGERRSPACAPRGSTRVHMATLMHACAAPRRGRAQAHTHRLPTLMQSDLRARSTCMHAFLCAMRGGPCAGLHAPVADARAAPQAVIQIIRGDFLGRNPIKVAPRLIAGMSRNSKCESLVEMQHPRVISSAVFSPASGRSILTTCGDNRLRLWDDIARVDGPPDRELVHSHDFNRYLTPFKAVWDPKDATERTAIIGRHAPRPSSADATPAVSSGVGAGESSGESSGQETAYSAHHVHMSHDAPFPLLRLLFASVPRWSRFTG